MDGESDIMQAERYLRYAGAVSGDHLDSAQEATVNALIGIGYALLSIDDALRNTVGGRS